MHQSKELRRTRTHADAAREVRPLKRICVLRENCHGPRCTDTDRGEKAAAEAREMMNSSLVAFSCRVKKGVRLKQKLIPL